MKPEFLTQLVVLLSDILRQLVDSPEAIIVTETVGEKVTLLEIHASPSDRGKIIGRGGEIVDALRQLAACWGGRAERSYRITLLEEALPAEPAPASTCTHAETSVASTVPLLIRMVQSVVDVPEQVVVNPLHTARTTIFEVTVAPRDVKKLLGRHGKTADALRRLLTSLGTRADRRYLLEVVEG